MKYYKVIKEGFSLDYLTAQDTVCFFCPIGMEIQCDEDTVWFRNKNGELQQTINWPHVVDIVGLENGQVEEIK